MMTRKMQRGTKEQGLEDKHSQVPSYLPNRTKERVKASLPFRLFSALWQVWRMWMMDQKAMA